LSARVSAFSLEAEVDAGALDRPAGVSGEGVLSGFHDIAFERGVAGVGEFVGDAFVDAHDGAGGVFPAAGETGEAAHVLWVESNKREDADECVGLFGLGAQRVAVFA